MGAHSECKLPTLLLAQNKNLPPLWTVWRLILTHSWCSMLSRNWWKAKYLTGQLHHHGDYIIREVGISPLCYIFQEVRFNCGSFCYVYWKTQWTTRTQSPGKEDLENLEWWIQTRLPGNGENGKRKPVWLMINFLGLYDITTIKWYLPKLMAKDILINSISSE